MQWQGDPDKIMGFPLQNLDGYTLLSEKLNLGIEVRVEVKSGFVEVLTGRLMLSMGSYIAI